MMRMCFIVRKCKCTTFLVKVFLLCFIIINLCLGVALLAMGLSYKYKHELALYFNYIDKYFHLIPNVIIAMGILVFFVAIMGLCGIATANICKIIIYLILMLLLFIIKAALLGYLVTSTIYYGEYYEIQLKKLIYRRVLPVLIKYHKDKFSRNWMDTLQTHFQCCGIGGYCDWKIVYPRSENKPDSCCMRSKWYHNTCWDDYFESGCLQKIYDILRKYAYRFANCLILICVMELISIITTICYLNMLRVDENIYDYPARRPVYLSTPLHDTAL